MNAKSNFVMNVVTQRGKNYDVMHGQQPLAFAGDVERSAQFAVLKFLKDGEATSHEMGKFVGGILYHLNTYCGLSYDEASAALTSLATQGHILNKEPEGRTERYFITASGMNRLTELTASRFAEAAKKPGVSLNKVRSQFNGLPKEDKQTLGVLLLLRKAGEGRLKFRREDYIKGALTADKISAWRLGLLGGQPSLKNPFEVTKEEVRETLDQLTKMRLIEEQTHASHPGVRFFAIRPEGVDYIHDLAPALKLSVTEKTGQSMGAA